jgi:hypothetical protein
MNAHVCVVARTRAPVVVDALGGEQRTTNSPARTTTTTTTTTTTRAPRLRVMVRLRSRRRLQECGLRPNDGDKPLLSLQRQFPEVSAVCYPLRSCCPLQMEIGFDKVTTLGLGILPSFFLDTPKYRSCLDNQVNYVVPDWSSVQRPLLRRRRDVDFCL